MVCFSIRRSNSKGAGNKNEYCQSIIIMVEWSIHWIFYPVIEELSNDTIKRYYFATRRGQRNKHLSVLRQT